MLHLIPTQIERKKLFYWLEKSSSYTAWERIGGFYKRWVDAFELLYEDTQRNPDPVHGVLMLDQEIVLVRHGYACFEDALARLKTGDKRPFVWLGQKGHFTESEWTVDHWGTAISKEEDGDIEVKAMYSSYWPQVGKTYAELNAAWSEVGIVEQPRFTDVPAEVGCVEELSRCRFPNTGLPDVPEPDIMVLVPTGETISRFGVWEPVKADMGGGFMGMLQKPRMPASGTFDVAGCMNYLHKGVAAPTLFAEDDGQRGEGRPTVWRLIWEDGRYPDGQVPAKEQDYVFFDAMAVASGEIAVQSGTWAVIGSSYGRINLKSGDRLPLYNGRSVLWLWSSF